MATVSFLNDVIVFAAVFCITMGFAWWLRRRR
jgi:hypothetical protein